VPEDGGLIDQALIGLKPVNAWVHTYTKPQTSSTRSRGLGWRIHESVEDTKLSTNKQHTLSHGARPVGAVCRGRSSEFVGCEAARYACKCPARAHHRSVRLRDCRMHVCGPKVVGVRGETQRGCKLEAPADRVGESVTERIIISYNSYPWGI